MFQAPVTAVAVPFPFPPIYCRSYRCCGFFVPRPTSYVQPAVICHPPFPSSLTQSPRPTSIVQHAVAVQQLPSLLTPLTSLLPVLAVAFAVTSPVQPVFSLLQLPSLLPPSTLPLTVSFAVAVAVTSNVQHPTSNLQLQLQFNIPFSGDFEYIGT